MREGVSVWGSVHVRVRVSVSLWNIDRDCGQLSVINSKKSSRATVVYSGFFFPHWIWFVRFIRNSQTSKKAESTDPTLGCHQGQSRWYCHGCAALLPTNKQIQLRPLSWRARLPAASPRGCCREVSVAAGGWTSACNVRRGRGPRARQLRTHQPCWPSSALGSSLSENVTSRGWWEGRHPVLGYCVFSGPVSQRWFLAAHPLLSASSLTVRVGPMHSPDCREDLWGPSLSS